MDKEIERYADRVFDVNSPLVFFPIRHHSPACSSHLKQAVDIYKPDCILVEGPCDTDGLIPTVVESEPPVAIYYSYSKDAVHAACYYPLMSYSPEFVAVKAAAELEIKSAFIDLPYGNKAVKPDRDKSEVTKDSYYGDYFFRRSRYVTSLCEKEGCRNYDELWEKLFELPTVSVETFIRNMFVLCSYSRADYPAELMEEEMDDVRELFMAENIRKYRKEYSRVMIVTGGFHTLGLIKLLDAPKPKEKVKPLYGESYLIAYSFAECDSLSWYESGMPYPGYYQYIHETADFEKSGLLCITKIAKALRKKNNNISLSEEAAAYEMAVGLARLRGKRQCGVYEILDGVRAAFVKGELNIANSAVMREAKLVLRGKKIGVISNSAPVPPIVRDFESEAKRLRLNLTETKTVTLDIISNPKHRDVSVFFHRLCLLENNFAKQTAGPDYVNRRSTRLVREIWNCSYDPSVTASLIEHSHLGGTVAEACGTFLSDAIEKSCNTAAEAAELLVKAGVTALFSQAEKLLKLSETLVYTDNSFVSLGSAAGSFLFLKGIKDVLRIDGTDRLDALLYGAIERALLLLPAVTAGSEKEDFALADTVKTLYNCAADTAELKLRYIETLSDIVTNSDCPPSVAGCAVGLLYSAGELTAADTLRFANGYFNSSAEIRLLTGRFLRGLFLTARDIVLYDNGDGFINGITDVLKELSESDFLKILPDLRLSFTFFSPLEIRSISEKAAACLGISSPENLKNMMKMPVVSESEYRAVITADAKAFDYLKQKGYVL